MATIEELKNKYINEYENIAAAMQATTDSNTYNELNELRNYKLGTLSGSNNATDQANAQKWGSQVITPQEFTNSNPANNQPTNIPQIQAPQDNSAALIQAILAQQLTKQNQGANFDQYMSSWKPDVSQQQYIDMVTNSATAAQNTAYNSNTNAIQQRLASILGQYSTQLGNLPGQYKGAYDANEQGAYDQSQSVKQVMARLGLLNSGVDLGNQKQTENTYNAARQGIDLQKQEEMNNINSSMGSARTDAEYGMADAEMKRQDAIAQAQANAGKEYMDYIQQQKEFAASNFWSGKNYDIDSQKVYNDLVGMAGNYSQGQQKIDLDVQKTNAELQQSATFFAESQGLEYAKLSQQDKQFYDQLAQEDRQYTESATRNADQFAQQMGFSREELAESGRQFDEKLGFSREELAQEKTLAEKQINNSLVSARLSAGYNEDGEGLNEKWLWEKETWEKEYQLELKGYSTNQQAYYTDEAARVGAGVNTLMQEYESLILVFTNKKDKSSREANKFKMQTLGNQMISLIKTSGMPDSAKTSYYKTITTAMNQAGIVTTVPKQSLSDTRDGGYTK